MKTTLSRLRWSMLALLTLAAIVSVSAYAWAGAKAGAAVTITTVSGTTTAEGTMGTVHHSLSSVEFIGCFATGTTSTGLSVTCSAQNSGLTTMSCTSSSANHVAVVNGINADSHLRVIANSGVCTEITVWHYSTHYIK